MSGSKNNIFGSNSNEKGGNFQANHNGFGGGQHEDVYRIVGVDDDISRFYYSPPQPQQQLPSCPSKVSWGPVDHHMYPGENQEQEAEQKPKMTIDKCNNDDWWKDAPMPTEDDFRYPSSSSNPPSNEPASKHETTNSAPRTPFTPQMDDNSMTPQQPPSQIISSPRPNQHSNIFNERTPLTPNQNDISNLERLNLNQTPGEAMDTDGDAAKYISPRERIDIHPEEPKLVKVYPPLNSVIVKEVFDPNEVRTWVAVNYYVLKEKVMDTYRTSSNSFIVNNSIHKNESICGLCSFEKPLATSNAITCRNQMGAGVRVTRENGGVWLSILSDHSVFVVCPFKNMINKVEKYTICRYKRESKVDENYQTVEADPISFKIFDDEIYDQEMSRLLAEGGVDKCVDNLPSLCCTRISFVKGFGGEYPRQHISQNPCWIDITMQERMADLDKICRANPIRAVCGSRS